MQAIDVPDRRSRAAIVFLLLVVAFAFQGSRGLWSPDEGRYVDVALEMLDSGDWIHPRLHHEVAHFTKPPLTYWAIAASIGTFGRQEWAARLPNTLAWLATLGLLVIAARCWMPERAWLPPLVYAAFPVPLLAANVVTTDTLLAACVATYVAGFALAGDGTTPRARATGPWLLWIGAAIAFLAKGPPALLVLAGLLAHAWTERERRPVARTYVRAWPLLAGLVLAFAWYLRVAADQPELVRYFLVEEVWNRVASDATHRNPHWYAPFTIYGSTLVVGSLPFTMLIVRAVARGLRTPVERARAVWSDPSTRRLLLWFGLPLLVFALAKSRLPLYLLPLFAPLAFGVARLLPERFPSRAWAVGLSLWLVALVGVRGAAAVYAHGEDDRALAAEVRALPLAAIGEVAFVDTAPRYGLSFYLGVEVERLTTLNVSPRPQAQDIASELPEPEGCRLLLTAEQAEPALRHDLTALRGDRWHELPRVGPYHAYVTDDGRCTIPDARAG
jgi:4-amino-4-deoxy-L-arabinose transferase-like glycosyltransferase